MWDVKVPTSLYQMKGRTSDVPGEQGAPPLPCGLQRTCSLAKCWADRPHWPGRGPLCHAATGAAVGMDSHSTEGQLVTIVRVQNIGVLFVFVFCHVDQLLDGRVQINCPLAG